MSYDKIVNELKEIRTKCIKINNISDNSMEDNNGDEEISPKKKKKKEKEGFSNYYGSTCRGYGLPSRDKFRNSREYKIMQKQCLSSNMFNI
jgi:hypothetical protein